MQGTALARGRPGQTQARASVGGVVTAPLGTLPVAANPIWTETSPRTCGLASRGTDVGQAQ